MNKEEKVKVVEDLKGQLSDYKSIYLTDIAGLDALQTSKLRRECFNSDIKLSVVKNTLLQKATLNTDFEQYFNELKGETAIALLNENYVEAAKSFMDIKKESPAFEIKFGYIDGNVITVNQLEAISKLPSREILISQFLSVINQPAVKFLYAAKSIPSSLVNVLNNLKDKK